VTISGKSASELLKLKMPPKNASDVGCLGENKPAQPRLVTSMVRGRFSCDHSLIFLLSCVRPDKRRMGVRDRSRSKILNILQLGRTSADVTDMLLPSLTLSTWPSRSLMIHRRGKTWTHFAERNLCSQGLSRAPWIVCGIVILIQRCAKFLQNISRHSLLHCHTMPLC
jgi:hypothetical protein